MPTAEEVAKLPYRPCVGIFLRNARGDIFAGARIHGAAGAWQAPQGGIDPGETPEQAALRELHEETGVPATCVRVRAETADWHRYDLPLEIVPTRWGGRFRGQAQKWFLIDLDADDSVIDITTESPEFSEWRWVSPDEMLDLIVPFKRDTYLGALAEFGLVSDP